MALFTCTAWAVRRPRSALGCAAQVARGAEPNEHGTWNYGRDGWCNGRQVGPRHLDVSRDVNLQAGAANELAYRGLWCPAVGNCTDPDPQYNTQGAPDMMVRFYVTFYGPASTLVLLRS